MSKVEIINRGLSAYLGERGITNLEAPDNRSKLLRLHYDPLRRSLLEKERWIFARGKVALAEVENDRSTIWEKKYAKPANTIEIHWVNDLVVANYHQSRGENPDAERENEGQYIYCNVDQAFCQFTKDVEDTSLMPQYFKEALSAMIAASVAMPITKSVDRARFAQDSANNLIEMAVAENEQLEPPIDMPESQVLKARGADYDFHYRRYDSDY